MPMSFFRKKRRRNKDNPRRVLIKQIVFGLMLFILVFMLGAGIWYGTRLEMLTIQAITVDEGETVDSVVVRKIVEEKLTGSYVGLVPRSFTWIYPEEEIEMAVLAIPKVKAVSLDLDNDEVLNISFTEYMPEALWCGDDGCVYMDKEGFAFANAANLAGGALIRFVGKSQPEIGVNGFGEEFIYSSFVLIETIYEKLGFNIVEVRRVTEDEAVYMVSGGGEVKISLAQPLEETLENFGTILSSQDYSHLAPGNFEYIDLRYGNKVFILEEEVVVAATSTVDSVAESTEPGELEE